MPKGSNKKLQQCRADLESWQEANNSLKNKLVAMFLVMLFISTGLILYVVAISTSPPVEERPYSNWDGSFYTMLTYAPEHGSVVKYMNVTVSYEDYFNYKFEANHTSHSYPDAMDVLNALSTYIVTDPITTMIASYVKANCTVPSNGEEVANAVLSICQDWGSNHPSIRYLREGVDAAKYPVETVVETTGDCEDQAILFIALMKSLGYDMALLITTEHAFAGVSLAVAPTHHIQPTPTSALINGTSYWVAETTAYGWKVGDLPLELEGETIYGKEI